MGVGRAGVYGEVHKFCEGLFRDYLMFSGLWLVIRSRIKYLGLGLERSGYMECSNAKYSSQDGHHMRYNLFR